MGSGSSCSWRLASERFNASLTFVEQLSIPDRSRVDRAGRVVPQGSVALHRELETLETARELLPDVVLGVLPLDESDFDGAGWSSIADRRIRARRTRPARAREALALAQVVLLPDPLERQAPAVLDL
jgi:hypothetical protein